MGRQLVVRFICAACYRPLMVERLNLIVARARALDLAPRARVCACCRLIYRHTGGVRRNGSWFCTRACAARGITRPRCVALALGSLGLLATSRELQG